MIQTKGVESICASAIPVIKLVAPGPEVAKQTPTFPVALAYPWAACTAPCSCLAKTCFNSSSTSYNASYTGIIAPPGYPNIKSTPSAIKA